MAASQRRRRKRRHCTRKETSVHIGLGARTKDGDKLCSEMCNMRWIETAQKSFTFKLPRYKLKIMFHTVFLINAEIVKHTLTHSLKFVHTMHPKKCPRITAIVRASNTKQSCPATKLLYSLGYISLVAHTALPRRSVCAPLIWRSSGDWLHRGVRALLGSTVKRIGYSQPCTVCWNKSSPIWHVVLFLFFFS